MRKPFGVHLEYWRIGSLKIKYNRSVYIRELKRWQTVPESIADEVILSYQYAEVIVDLCYN